MKLRKFLKDKGQTSIEYILMLAVSVGLGLTFMKNFQAYLIDNPDSYINIHMKFYKDLFDPDLGYKKYRLPR